MYIRKADKKLFEELDKCLILPKKFDNFIDNISKKHNLIIKNGSNSYYCTNCKNHFKSKKTRINDELKCPNCRFKFIVKGTILKHFNFYDCVGILDRYKDYWIIRYFEIASNYDGQNFERDVCEYGRKIFDNDFRELYEIINDNVYTGIGICTVKHYYDFNFNWRYFSSYWKNLGDSLIFYPGNMKKILLNTKYQYSQMWELVKHVEYVDLQYLLRFYDPSFEFLIKMKLYNLVGRYDFARGKNFQERFGLEKEFLPFMQKNNINYDELEVLKFYRKKNINTIRIFKNCMNLNDLKEYKIDLDLLLKLTDFNENKYSEYCDYLRFAKQLDYNLKDKKILYPHNIEQAHDKLLAQIEVAKNQKINKKISIRYDELKENIYQNKRYIIYPTSNIEDLISESRMQNNCVKTYAEKIANKECDIYFMRLISNKNKSLVTVEVRNNEIIQKRTKNNQCTTKEQDEFLNKWEKDVLNTC